MKFKTINELRSPQAMAYQDLRRFTLRLPAEDIERLQAYAHAHSTTANEVIRVILSKHLERSNHAKPRL